MFRVVSAGKVNLELSALERSNSDVKETPLNLRNAKKLNSVISRKLTNKFAMFFISFLFDSILVSHLSTLVHVVSMFCDSCGILICLRCSRGM